MDVKQRKVFKSPFRGLYQKGFLVESSILDEKVKEVKTCVELNPDDGDDVETQIQSVSDKLPAFCNKMTN